MGLKQLTAKELKKAQRIIKALEFYGVTEEDIPLIAEIKSLKESVAVLKKEVTALKNTSAEISRQYYNPSADYSKGVEEFYPHGRP